MHRDLGGCRLVLVRVEEREVVPHERLVVWSLVPHAGREDHLGQRYPGGRVAIYMGVEQVGSRSKKTTARDAGGGVREGWSG
jgi:hypothetical protein